MVQRTNTCTNLYGRETHSKYALCIYNYVFSILFQNTGSSSSLVQEEGVSTGLELFMHAATLLILPYFAGSSKQGAGPSARRADPNGYKDGCIPTDAVCTHL